jgi:transposase, IS6 family
VLRFHGMPTRPAAMGFVGACRDRVCCRAVTDQTEQEQCLKCPHCQRQNIVKNGRDRRGAPVYYCADCQRNFTALTGTPFSGHSFPPAVIGLAVRWYLRYRLRYADVVEWLAERHILVDASTVFDWVQKFAPLYQDAAKAHRHRVGSRWSVDETYVKVAGRWGYVYRAIDEYGQIIEVLFREHRDTEAAAAFFRAALESTGVTPHTVTTDKAAAYPPALAEVFPEVEHLAGKAVPQRIERDHQHLKGRLRVFRGCQTAGGAQRFCQAHGFLRNLRQGFYRLGAEPRDPNDALRPRLVRAWEELTSQWLAS